MAIVINDGSSGNTGGLGTRRLGVTPSAPSRMERRRSAGPPTGLKPYFNDFAVHKGYAFGFDGRHPRHASISPTAQRKWKGGRYGNGQLLLSNEQDLLVVLSEEGELVLVGAAPAGSPR